MLENACKSLNAAAIALDLSTSGDFIDVITSLQKLIKPQDLPEKSQQLVFAYIHPTKQPFNAGLALSHTSFRLVCKHLEDAKKSIIESDKELVIILSKEFAEVISILDQVELFKGRS